MRRGRIILVLLDVEKKTMSMGGEGFVKRGKNPSKGAS